MRSADRLAKLPGPLTLLQSSATFLQMRDGDWMIWRMTAKKMRMADGESPPSKPPQKLLPPNCQRGVKERNNRYAIWDKTI